MTLNPDIRYVPIDNKKTFQTLPHIVERDEEILTDSKSK